MKARRFLTLVLVVVMAVAMLPVVAAESTTMTDPSVGSAFYGDNGYSKGQCTWYACGRYMQLGGSSLKGLGDAKDWYKNAEAKGFSVGTTPKVGAVACWNANSNGGFSAGHVAVVEQVLADGSIRVSQYNRDVKNSGGLKFGGWNDKQTWEANYLEKVPGKSFPPKPNGYIYLPDDATESGSSTPAKTFTVSFDPNGGIMAPTKKSFTVGKHERLGTLPTPTRDGYDFSGWTLSSTAPEDRDPRIPTSRMVIAAETQAETLGDTDCTLWAEWSFAYYTVEFNANGGIVSASSKYVYYTTPYDELPTPSYPGYTFNGWYTSANGGSRITNDTKVTTAGNHTLYAHWTRSDCNGNHTKGAYLSFETNHPHREFWTCSICGEKFTDGSTKVLDSCAICNSQKTNCDNGHIFGDWKTVTETSCETEGRQERTCSVCGAKETQTIAALGHDYNASGKCRNCGAVYDIVDHRNGNGSANFISKLPFNSVSTYCSGLFSDVTDLDWFYLNVSTAYELGLMKGTGPSAFSPSNNVTIAETITLAARIHCIYNTGWENFPSYDGGNWYDPYVDYARENGIINTYYDYTQPATREQFVHILAKALPEAELADITSGISFADSNDITCAGDVKLLSGAGVINGITEDGQTYFKPWNAITRAEVAAVVGRMVQPDIRRG